MTGEDETPTTLSRRNVLKATGLTGSVALGASAFAGTAAAHDIDIVFDGCQTVHIVVNDRSEFGVLKEALIVEVNGVEKTVNIELFPSNTELMPERFGDRPVFTSTVPDSQAIVAVSVGRGDKLVKNPNECVDDADDGEDCPDCPVDPGTVTASDAVDVQTVDTTGFPNVTVPVRVNTAAGQAGNLTTDDLFLCEGGCRQDVSVTFASRTRADIVFVLDASASMGAHIDSLRNNIRSFIDNVEGAGIDARYALVQFSDTPDDLVGPVQDFTGSDRFKEALGDVNTEPTPSIGADEREANFDAIERASNLSYRDGAQRIMVDVTDSASDTEVRSPRETDLSMADVEQILEDGGFSYFAVSPVRGDLPDLLEGDPELGNKRVLANNIGGEWIDIGSGNFGQILDQIETTLTAAYTLEYTTTDANADGSTRSILVGVEDPDRGTLFGQASYTAPN